MGTSTDMCVVLRTYKVCLNEGVAESRNCGVGSINSLMDTKQVGE